MKVLHLSDLHVTAGHRLEDQRATLHELVTRALAAQPDLVLLTGDLYGKAVPHDPSPHERGVLEPELVRLAERCPIVVVPGNHDHAPTLARLPDLGGLWPITVPTVAGVVEVHTPAGVADVYVVPYPWKRHLVAALGDDGPREPEATRAAIGAYLEHLLVAWAGRIERKRRTDPTRVHLLAAHVAVKGGTTAGGEVLGDREIELSMASLDALPVDYGALGHLHLRQHVAGRCYYPGSPWRTDHGEREPRKVQHLVVLGEASVAPAKLAGDPMAPVERLPGPGMHGLVIGLDTRCRDFRTLAWRWAADELDGDDAPARWVVRPSDAEVAACAGAEVRARVTRTDQVAAGFPWAAEQARLEAAGVHYVLEEHAIEANHRVRAPQVAAATTTADKVRGYWTAIAAEPAADEQAAAFDALAELQEHVEDRPLRDETRRLAGLPIEGTPSQP